MKKLTLATSATCGPCSALKRRILSEGLTVETRDYSQPQNIPFFREHGIRSVPRLIVEEDGKVEVIQGTEEILEAIRNSEA